MRPVWTPPGGTRLPPRGGIPPVKFTIPCRFCRFSAQQILANRPLRQYAFLRRSRCVPNHARSAVGGFIPPALPPAVPAPQRWRMPRMLQIGRYVFKRAETSEELKQVHQLNYRTFVREIPQYPDDGNGYLIDKFHDKNIYFVCLRSDRVVGMISCHDGPPFSVAERHSDPGILYRPGMRPMEVRLLAIEPAERHSTVFLGLLCALYEYTRDNGYTDLFISGVANRVSLYQHMGFAPLGPAVPSGRASFVPMRATLRHVEEKLHRAMSLWRKHLRRLRLRRSAPDNGAADAPVSANGAAEELVCLLPGPVTAAPAVRAAFHRPPIYHRGPEFITLFQKVRRRLSDLVGGKDVALFNGSGMLGNEAVA